MSASESMLPSASSLFALRLFWWCGAATCACLCVKVPSGALGTCSVLGPLRMSNMSSVPSLLLVSVCLGYLSPVAFLIEETQSVKCVLVDALLQDMKSDQQTR